MYGPEQGSLGEKARLLSNLPLFMRELPQGGLDEDAAIQMEALQSLLYDGDAEGLSTQITMRSYPPVKPE